MVIPILSHNLSRCFSSDSIPWHDIGDLWPGPCEGRILRALDDGTVRSAIVRIRKGSRSCGIESVAATVQGFVVSGRIIFGHVELGPSGFFVVPTGQALPQVEAGLDAEVLIIFDDAKTAKPRLTDAVILPIADSIEPITPIIDGVELKGLNAAFSGRILMQARTPAC